MFPWQLWREIASYAVLHGYDPLSIDGRQVVMRSKDGRQIDVQSRYRVRGEFAAGEQFQLYYLDPNHNTARRPSERAMIDVMRWVGEEPSDSRSYYYEDMLGAPGRKYLGSLTDLLGELETANIRPNPASPLSGYRK